MDRWNERRIDRRRWWKEGGQAEQRASGWSERLRERERRNIKGGVKENKKRIGRESKVTKKKAEGRREGARKKRRKEKESRSENEGELEHNRCERPSE